MQMKRKSRVANMLKSMKIPRKLGLSFLTVCATAAIVMLVFYTNISSIRSTTDANNLSQSIHAKAQALETAVAAAEQPDARLPRHRGRELPQIL